MEHTHDLARRVVGSGRGGSRDERGRFHTEPTKRQKENGGENTAENRLE